MDPISQGVLGASCAEAVLFNYDKKRAWIAGGLAGMAPDLDLLIRSSADPLLSLLYHRQFTHSLIFMPVGALLVAATLYLFKHFRQHWFFVFLACLIGYATHAPLDSLTSYGTVLLWPFSYNRVSLDYISIIDPLFTFPILLGLIWTLIFQKRNGVLTGLSFAFLFLCFNIMQHHRVISTVTTYAHEHHLNIKKLRSFPALASSTYWRVVFKNHDQFMLGDVHAYLTQPTQFKKIGAYSAFDEKKLPAYIKQSSSLLRDFKIFNWFTDGYLIATQKDPLLLVDGRYLIGQTKPRALWGILFLQGKEHIIKKRFIPLK